jgi:hypothetical protein
MAIVVVVVTRIVVVDPNKEPINSLSARESGPHIAIDIQTWTRHLVHGQCDSTKMTGCNSWVGDTQRNSSKTTWWTSDTLCPIRHHLTECTGKAWGIDLNAFISYIPIILLAAVPSGDVRARARRPPFYLSPTGDRVHPSRCNQ